MDLRRRIFAFRGFVLSNRPPSVLASGCTMYLGFANRIGAAYLLKKDDLLYY